jgi:hypothetical protein
MTDEAIVIQYPDELDRDGVLELQETADRVFDRSVLVVPDSIDTIDRETLVEELERVVEVLTDE